MPTFSIPLSGLTASSTALATIANNLANLNTVGYKDARVLFRDLFYQSIGSNGAGDAIQQGAGAAVGSIPTSFTQGNVDPSGVSTDVAILGDGFFVVSKNGALSYTRAGNFEVNKASLLVTSDGQTVLGYPAVNGVITPAQGLGPLTLGCPAVYVHQDSYERMELFDFYSESRRQRIDRPSRTQGRYSHLRRQWEADSPSRGRFRDCDHRLRRRRQRSNVQMEVV